MAKTNRQITHKYKAVIKGAVPEPVYPGVCFPLLGNNIFNMSKLPAGYNKGCARYILDESNDYLSPDTLPVEGITEVAEVAPAVGPELTPTLQNCYVSDFTSILDPMTIYTLNTYYRLLTTQQLTIIEDPAFYGVNSTNVAVTAIESQVSSQLQIIANSQAADDAAFAAGNVSTIELVWAPNTPTTVTGPGNAAVMGVDTFISDWLSTTTYIDTSSTDSTVINAIGNQKDVLIDSLDVQDTGQDIFGYPDLNCIQRTDSTPYVPFVIQKNTPLKVGIPFIIRFYLDSVPQGMTRGRIHFDLGNNLRMTFEQGTNIKIGKKRTVAQIKTYLAQNSQNEQITELQNIFNTFGANGATDVEFMNAAEAQLEAYEMSEELFNPLAVPDPNYSTVITALSEQGNQLLDFRKQIATIKLNGKNTAETQAGHKLTPQQKAAQKEEISAITSQITTLKNKANKDEGTRKKIAIFESLLYSSYHSISLPDMEIINSPIEIKITDYGCGMVLFDFNKGKNTYIFKDTDFLEQNTIPKRSQFVVKNRIRTLTNDSYQWTIDGPLTIRGNGGSFMFAYDDVSIASAEIQIPVASQQQLNVSTDNNSSTMTLNQIIEIMGVTNLPAYGTTTITNTGNMCTITSPVGTITISLEPIAGPNSYWTQGLDGYTEWVQFLSGNSTTPYISEDVDTSFYYFNAVVTFTPTIDANNRPIGIPLFFRGTINVLADSPEWSDSSNPNNTIADDTPGHEITTDYYTIKIETILNENKKRPIYQIALTLRDGLGQASIPDANRFPDYAVGKRVDLFYQYPQSVLDTNWIPIVTDGYITEVMYDEMQTVTQTASGLASPVPVAGFFFSTEVKITFNVTDLIRFTEDKRVVEGTIWEGYNYVYSVRCALINSGIPSSKLTLLNPDSPIGGIYAASSTNAKYLPVAAPGQKHSFIINKRDTRWQEIDLIVSNYGWTPNGNTYLWVDSSGQVHVDGPVQLATDPRFGNARMIYTSRGIASRSSLSDAQASSYIYFKPLKRTRVLDQFYSSIQVQGPVSPTTGKFEVVGVQKKESVDPAYKQESVYLGHYRDKEIFNLHGARTNDEMIGMLYYLYNEHTTFRETWVTCVPFNPFILSNGIVFILPDNAGYDAWFHNSQVALNGAPISYSNQAQLLNVAYRVVDIKGSEIDDEMELTVSTLSAAEQAYLLTLLG